MRELTRVLLVRARLAADEAEELRHRSVVLCEVTRRNLWKEPQVQCAWCEMFTDGKGEWWPIDARLVRTGAVTSTVCPSCFDDLLPGYGYPVIAEPVEV